jgi:hypothetical protein
VSSARRGGASHPCPSCRAAIPPRLFACRPCWFRLPLDIRDRINFGYGDRQANPTAHRRAMAEGTAWFRANPAGGQ